MVTSNQNIGHGHVRPRPDGVKARCGGPGLCVECSRELAELNPPHQNAFDTCVICGKSKCRGHRP